MLMFYAFKREREKRKKDRLFMLQTEVNTLQKYTWRERFRVYHNIYLRNDMRDVNSLSEQKQDTCDISFDMSGRISRRFVSYFSATVNHDRRDQVSLLLPPIYISIALSHFCLLPLFIFLLCLSLFICFLTHRDLYFFGSHTDTHIYIRICGKERRKKMKRNRVKTIPCSISFHLFYFRPSCFFSSLLRDP